VQKPKKQNGTAGRIVSLLLYMLAGAFIGGAHFGEIQIAGRLNIVKFFLIMLLIFVFVYLAILLQIIAHEAGHLVFGKLSGYGFASFRIGNLMLVKTGARLRLKRFSVMGTGGPCLMTPPEYCENMPVLLYNFGGCVGNLVLSAAAAAVGWVCGNAVIITIFIRILLIMGIVMALQNGIPMRIGPISNDGRNALELARDGVARWCFWAQLQISGRLAAGMRLKEMPGEWFVMPEGSGRRSGICAAIGVLACNRAMDAMDFTSAAGIGHGLLEDAAGLLGLHRLMITCDMIYCGLIFGEPQEKIEKMLSPELVRFFKSVAQKILLRFGHSMRMNCWQIAMIRRRKRS